MDKPKQKIEIEPENKIADPKVDRAIMAAEIQKDTYKALMKKIDAKFHDSIYAGNIFKAHMKLEMLSADKNRMPEVLQKLSEDETRYEKMFDYIVKNQNSEEFAKKLSVRAGTPADRLAESAWENRVTNSAQMAIIKFYAMVKGISYDLRMEYESYIKQIPIPDILDKFSEIYGV